MNWDLSLVWGPFCEVSFTCFTGTQVLGQFGETWPEYPKSCVETQKVIQSFQCYISHWMRSYSSAKPIWELSYTCFRGFGALGELWEIGPSALIFLKLSNFIILTYGVLNFLSRMGSINSFGQAVQEILLNNYLKSNFENSKIRDFVPTFCNFIRGKISLKKSPLFLNFKCNYLKSHLW